MKQTKSKLVQSQQSGYVMIIVTMVTVVLAAMSTSLMSVVVSRHQRIAASVDITNAVYIAEAGVSATISRLTGDTTFTGFPDSPRTVLYDKQDRGRAEYTTTVTGTGTSRTVVSNGYLYASGTNNLLSQKTVRVKLSGRTESHSGKYSLFVGHGGLSLNGTLHTAANGGGNVYIQGQAAMESISVIGDDQPASTKLKVDVANVGCGTADGPYPVACATNPVTLNGVNTPRIYGDVCATGQPATSWMVNDGLKLGCVAESLDMPIFNKQQFINKMTTTKTANTNSCQGFTVNVTWTANTIYNGDKVANLGSILDACNVVVAGDIYINGGLTINGLGSFAPAAALGTNTATIVVNGPIVFNGGRSIERNASKAGIRFISLHSTDAACTASTSCAGLSSTAHVYNSARTPAITTASGFAAVGSIFWAQYGKVTIGSGAAVGSVMGQQVEVQAGTTVGQMKKAGFPSSDITPIPDFNVTKNIWSVIDYQQLK